MDEGQPVNLAAGVLIADDTLEFVTKLVVVPVMLAEELLERARCDARVDGDRLDALFGDVVVRSKIPVRRWVGPSVGGRPDGGS